MIFTPADPLALETEYVFTVDEGIRDLSGNPMTEPPAPFEFVTAGRPILVESEPADGAELVALDAPIALTFSTLMDITSVEDQLRLSPSFDHELRWSGELLEIVPSQPLEPGSDYAVEVDADAADAAGVTLGDPIRIAFRTVTSDLTALTLVPTDGVDGVAPISPIAVIFNQPIDPQTVAGEQLTISPDVAGTLEVVALPDDPPDDDRLRQAAAVHAIRAPAAKHDLRRRARRRAHDDRPAGRWPSRCAGRSTPALPRRPSRMGSRSSPTARASRTCGS